MTTPRQKSPRGSGGARARAMLLAHAAVLAIALPAVAHAAAEDPWEPANRTFYMVHQVIDQAVFSKVAAAFRMIPEPIRKAVRNIISNLSEPGVAANDMLQGHPALTARTLARLTVNTTMGVGGIFDVAGKTGLPHHDNNFGNTFGRWGAAPGPYLFITFIGPTTVRDGAGAIADALTDPFTWARFYHRWTIIDVRTVWQGLDQRVEADAQLQAVNSMSTDSYASLRSLYLQNRAAVIAAPPDAPPGAAPASAPLPDLPDFGDPAPAQPDAAPTSNAAPAPNTPPDQGANPAPDVKPAASNPDSEVLATNRRDGQLLALLSLRADPNG